MTKICVRCGNEIPDTATACHFCGARQGPGAGTGQQRRLRTVNIEDGMPTSEEALARLESTLQHARQTGVRVLRLIHGWGSTGTGGKLRNACRSLLRRKLLAHQVTAVVYGEDYAQDTEAGQNLISRCPELRNGIHSDSRNPGITLILL